MIMMISPNSRARKGGKERGGEVQGYEGISWEEEDSADYGEWCNLVRNMLHHV